LPRVSWGYVRETGRASPGSYRDDDSGVVVGINTEVLEQTLLRVVDNGKGNLVLVGLGKLLETLDGIVGEDEDGLAELVLRRDESVDKKHHDHAWKMRGTASSLKGTTRGKRLFSTNSFSFSTLIFSLKSTFLSSKGFTSTTPEPFLRPCAAIVRLSYRGRKTKRTLADRGVSDVGEGDVVKGGGHSLELLEVVARGRAEEADSRELVLGKEGIDLLGRVEGLGGGANVLLNPLENRLLSASTLHHVTMSNHATFKDDRQPSINREIHRITE
jgi:hypothetical protein